jgi:hypothetical protein
VHSPQDRFHQCQSISFSPETEIVLNQKRCKRSLSRFALCLVLTCVASAGIGVGQTQSQAQNSAALPFEVSNPQNKKWQPAEARRIYNSACQLLARTIRPDKPPELHPQFLLVLGTENNEFVRDGSRVEVHLRNWQPEMFAQAVVAVAVRDILQWNQLQQVAHQSVQLENATVDAHDLH